MPTVLKQRLSDNMYWITYGTITAKHVTMKTVEASKARSELQYIHSCSLAKDLIYFKPMKSLSMYHKKLMTKLSHFWYLLSC